MIRVNDTHSINLIARAARVTFVPHLHHCIAEYNSNDSLVGGVLFTDWNHGSVLAHFAIFQREGGIGRQLLWLAFQYPFVQLGVKKLIGLVPEWNINARNLDLKLGFKIEYKLDDIFNFPDPTLNGMYIMTMRKEDCKWLNMKQPIIRFAPTELVNVIPLPPEMISMSVH